MPPVYWYRMREPQLQEDMEWVLRIAEQERQRLLHRQENTAREEGRELGLAILRLRGEVDCG